MFKSSSKLSMIGRIAQILIGIVYLVAGAIKSVEPVVFSYQIRSFLEVLFPFLAGEWLFAACLWLAFFMIALELCLGLALVINYRVNIAIPVATLVMMGFIVILLVAWDKVENCGCFGALFERSAAESAAEDLIFLLLLIVAWIGRRGAEVKSGRLYSYPMLLMLIVSISLPLYFAKRPNFFAKLKVGMSLQKELSEQVSEIDAFQITVLDTVIKESISQQDDGLRFNIENFVKRDTVTVMVDRKASYINDLNLVEGEHLIFLISPTCDHCRSFVPIFNWYYYQYVIGALPVPVMGLFRSPPTDSTLAEQEKNLRHRYRMGRYIDEEGNWYTEDRYGPLTESALFPIGYLTRGVHGSLAHVVPRTFLVKDGIVTHVWDGVPDIKELATIYPSLDPLLLQPELLQ